MKANMASGILFRDRKHFLLKQSDKTAISDFLLLVLNNSFYEV